MGTTDRRFSMARAIAVAVVAIAIFASPAAATTHHIDWTGGGDYLTIQEGIDAASEATGT